MVVGRASMFGLPCDKHSIDFVVFPFVYSTCFYSIVCDWNINESNYIVFVILCMGPEKEDIDK